LSRFAGRRQGGLPDRDAECWEKDLTSEGSFIQHKTKKKKPKKTKKKKEKKKKKKKKPPQNKKTQNPKNTNQGKEGRIGKTDEGFSMPMKTDERSTCKGAQLQRQRAGKRGGRRQQSSGKRSLESGWGLHQKKVG